MTNQALPESVRRQLEEAEALEQQVYGQPTPEAGNTEPVAEPEPTPAEPVVEDVQVAQPEVAAVKEEEETYRRKYDVLQGKFDAEVPRLYAQLRDATGQLQQALTEVQTLRAAQNTPKPEPTAPDNDAETFGEDLTEAIDRRSERKAEAMVNKQIKPLMEYIKQLETRLGDVNQQVEVSSQDRFLNNLAKQVPDYETVNTEQGFLNWLGEVDPVYGVPRQAALDAASERMDADRTAQVFLAYKQLTGKQVTQQQTQQVRKELERQTAPNTPSSSPKPAATGNILSRAQYEYAFDPRTIREIGQAKADELMAEADRAYAEGRVQW